MTRPSASVPGKSTFNTDVVVGCLVEQVRQQRIVQAFEFASHDPAFAETVMMRWVLDATAIDTTVTVIAVWPDHEMGMNSSLTHLAVHVESHG